MKHMNTQSRHQFDILTMLSHIEPLTCSWRAHRALDWLLKNHTFQLIRQGGRGKLRCNNHRRYQQVRWSVDSGDKTQLPKVGNLFCNLDYWHILPGRTVVGSHRSLFRQLICPVPSMICLFIILCPLPHFGRSFFSLTWCSQLGTPCNT